MIQGLIAGVVFAALIWFFDLPLAAGAHPFWAEKVIWIGAPIGLFAFVITNRFALVIQAILGFAVAALASLAAVQGKAIFAASYAENALAGQAWYFGWIGVCAGLTLFVSTGTRFISPKPAS